MYKLMIVDDQIMEIEAIRELLDWTELGIEIAGQATNGKQALEEAKRLQPDILIADIVMPGMDGLELMRQVSELLPDIKIAFMSCFDDFKFVGPAINQGAYGYVLKPILAGELAKTIHRILKTCEREKKNLELLRQKQKIEAGVDMLRESFFRNLLFGGVEDAAHIRTQGDYLGLELTNRSFCAAVVELERSEGEKVLFHAVSVAERLRQHFSECTGVDFILLDLHRICVLFTGQAEAGVQQKKVFIQRAQAILDYITDAYDIAAAAGIGTVCDSLQGIAFSFKQAMEALKNRFYFEKLRVIDIEEVILQVSEMEVETERIHETIRQVLVSGDEILLAGLVDGMLSVTKSREVLKYICYTMLNSLQIQLLQMQMNLEDITGSYEQLVKQICSRGSLQELREWLLGTLRTVLVHVQNNTKIENRELACKMLEFIRSSFQQPILLQDVAEHVYMSPGYANYIFKTSFGKTVHQCIEELRMEKAVQLLSEEKDERIYRIAEKAGYCDSAYFINVFRKVHGCTPAEFRKRKIVWE